MQTDNPYQSPQSKLDINNTRTINVDINLADRSERFLGALVDGLAVSLAWLIIAYFSGFFKDFISPIADFHLGLQIIIYFVTGLLIFMLIHGYFIYNNAQTLGKYFLGMQVVDHFGEPISGNHYFLKRILPLSIVQNIPIAGGVIGLINALLIFRDSHKCLHDDIAQTKVISLGDIENPINIPDLIKPEKETDLYPKVDPDSPDYGSYTFAELVSALDAIDKEQHPNRVVNLTRQLQKKKELKDYN